jgi:sugar/nucleoside kinase (ribokinase family)
VALLDWPEALRFANRAAALSTMGLGAQSALPTLSDVVARLADAPTETTSSL